MHGGLTGQFARHRMPNMQSAICQLMAVSRSCQGGVQREFTPRTQCIPSSKVTAVTEWKILVRFLKHERTGYSVDVAKSIAWILKLTAITGRHE